MFHSEKPKKQGTKKKKQKVCHDQLLHPVKLSGNDSVNTFALRDFLFPFAKDTERIPNFSI